MNYDLGDDMYSFDALIEGSLEDIHLTYVVKDSMGWQMIHVRNDKYEDNPTKFRVLYVYITEENAVEHEIEGAELLDLDAEHGVDIEDLLA